jgi:hypothetical protein
MGFLLSALEPIAITAPLFGRFGEKRQLQQQSWLEWTEYKKQTGDQISRQR